MQGCKQEVEGYKIIYIIFEFTEFFHTYALIKAYHVGDITSVLQVRKLRPREFSCKVKEHIYLFIRETVHDKA